MEQQQLTKLLEQSFPFWDHLDDTDRESLLTSSRDLRFPKGANIHDGNDCTGVILVKSGSLRLYILSEDGKEITLYRLFAGDLCVMSASCVLNAITFDVFVDSEESSECVIVSGKVLEEISERLPEVKIFMLETALSRFSDVMWVLQQILFMSMDKRLAIFLLDESSKTGSDRIRLTHEQIAKYMGSAREVVSRMLKYFATEGMITTSRADGIHIVDKKRLRSLIV